MAIGIDVVPTLSLSRNGTTPGTRNPSRIPPAIAAKIQTVRYRSRSLRRRGGSAATTGRERVLNVIPRGA